MASRAQQITRRGFLATSAVAATASIAVRTARAAAPRRAQIAITLDLEMCRNFPKWEDTKWDYEKGNLDADTIRYAVEAGRRVAERGGRIHYFCVGRVLEQPDVAWLTQLAKAGHAIGNHTYDHVNVLAKRPEDVQYRFQRAPWLLEGKSPAEAIRENIRLTTLALKQRAGIDNRGFRTPGGFTEGLSDREDVQTMLQELGFRWVSSKYPEHPYGEPMQEPTPAVLDGIVRALAAAQPFAYPSGLVEIPMSPISDIGAFRTGRWKLAWFLEAIRRAVTWTIDQRATFDFLAHPACLLAVDPKFQAIDLICELVAQSSDHAELVDLDAIARQVAR